MARSRTHTTAEPRLRRARRSRHRLAGPGQATPAPPVFATRRAASLATPRTWPPPWHARPGSQNPGSPRWSRASSRSPGCR